VIAVTEIPVRLGEQRFVFDDAVGHAEEHGTHVGKVEGCEGHGRGFGCRRFSWNGK
jgi:hypothetical protein